MKKILITGANGFIGKNLVEGLKNKYEIFAPKRNELNLLSEEEVKKYIKKNKFDVIIHSATQNASRNAKEPLDFVLERNLRMFSNLENCNEYYGKMYYFGSGAEYDMNNYIPFMKEEYFGTHIPSDQYGFSKYIMSKIANPNNNIYDLRLFGVYGKYEDWEIRFISNAVCKAMHDIPITIKQNVLFDYLYIDDLVKIMEWFIENTPKYKHYNLCTGSSVDLKSIAKKILEVYDKSLEIKIASKGLKREYSGNNTRLLNEMGDYKFIDITQGIIKLKSYYKTIKDQIAVELLKNDK